MSFATLQHLRKFVEFRSRLHCTDDFMSACQMRLAMAIFEFSTSSSNSEHWNSVSFVNDFTKSKWDQPIDEVSPGPAWQSTIRLAQKHFGKDWGCGLDTAKLSHAWLKHAKSQTWDATCISASVWLVNILSPHLFVWELSGLGVSTCGRM